MEQVAVASAQQVVEHGGAIAAVLLLVIMGLMLLVWILLKDARDERKLNRDALVANTAVLARFEEVLRTAINLK